MRTCFPVLLGLLLACLPAKAQLLHAPKELPAAFRAAPKLLVGLDGRRSFISNRDVKLLGVRVGLEFEKRMRVGFGLYTLASPFTRTFVRVNDLGIPDTLHPQLRFSYMTAFGEYILLSTQHWEVSFPLQLGIGDAGFQGLAEEPQAFLLGEVGIWASYKVFPFLGLAGGVGYRHILLGGNLIRENFNAPTYSFGLKLWTGYLLDKVFKKSS